MFATLLLRAGMLEAPFFPAAVSQMGCLLVHARMFRDYSMRMEGGGNSRDL